MPSHSKPAEMKLLFIWSFLLSAFPLSSFLGTPGNTLSADSDTIPAMIEKVYLHLDRATYYPGDDLWFKAYLVDASGLILTEHSSNLHAELISPADTIIESHNLKITGGMANGDFHLPSNLVSGIYQVRAYTNYMRNYGDELFFRKNIMIINSSEVNSTLSSIPVNRDNERNIQFFPEGGSLVDYVTGAVAFKAEDGNGRGLEVSGRIVSSKGDTVAGFRTSHDGMGKFLLNPVRGLKYYAIAPDRNGDPLRFELPVSFHEGIVMNVVRNTPEQISLILRTNSETLSSMPDEELTLLISTRNTVFDTYAIKLKSLVNSFSIPAGSLPEGIVMLTLKGVNNRYLCERLVFINRGSEARIGIETNKEVFASRDSVSVKITMTGNLHDSLPEACLSLSSAEDMLTGNPYGDNSTISSWFLLESDIRGPVENPASYFDTSNPGRFENLDLLLMTQGWRDFKWKYDKPAYTAEHGFTVSGRVRKVFADQPVENASVNFVFFGENRPFSGIAGVDSSGKFILDGLDIRGDLQFVASITDEKDKLKGWLIMDSTRYTPAEIRKSQFPVILPPEQSGTLPDFGLTAGSKPADRKLDDFIQYGEYKESIKRKYRLSDTIALGEVKITAKKIGAPESARDRARHYLRATPDRELVIPENYKGFGSVYLLANAKFVAPLKLPWGMPFRMQYPLYLIDGAEATEDDVKALPVSAVERIDILNPTAFYGVFGPKLVKRDTSTVQADGAISIILRSDYTRKRPELHSASLKIHGYYEPRIFYSPVHHSLLESDYKPDLRSTVFWKPDIVLKNNEKVVLNYFNTDNPSVIKITIEGITSTGIPVTATAKYTVK